jgi:hypothetical protein
VRFGVWFLAATLFLHDGGICMFIPASGAYVHLFRPRPERGNEKPNGFQENHSIFTKNERFSGKPSGFQESRAVFFFLWFQNHFVWRVTLNFLTLFWPKILK